MLSAQKANILLVDDSPTNLLVLEGILKSLNVNLVKALSGEVALKCLKEQEFAVILLDIQMPNMDGFETANLIRERERNGKNSSTPKRPTPIIFVTGFDSNAPDQFKGYSLGAVDYLIKPINPEILKTKVKVFVELFKNAEAVERQAEQLKIANKQLESDIARRQLVEQALRESEERFRSAFDYAAIGMALVGLDGRFLKVNRSLCDIVGYSEQELLAIDFQLITHPDDIERDQNYISQLLAGEIRFFKTEKRCVHKLGHIVWILLNASLLRDVQDQPLYFVAQIQDITERRRQEEALMQLASIVEAADDAISSENLDGIIGTWNLGAQKIYGYTAEEIKGQSASILIPPSHPDELTRILTTIKQGGRFDNYETVRVRKDKEQINVSLTISPIKDPTGKIIGTATLARDISDRKRIEETLKRLWHKNKLILNSAGEGICGLDTEGKVKFINPAAATMLGYDIAELIDEPIQLIFNQSEPEGTNSSLEERLIYAPLKEGKACQGNNEIFWRKDGSSFPVEWMSTSIQEDGEIVGLVLTFKDITERQVVEQMKEEFVSVVSHELRTPLTSIRGALGLLAGGLLTTQPEKAQRMLEIAVTNTDRLVRLINDILDIERIESGTVSMNKQICDAATLMTQAAEVMQAMAEKAKVTITVTPVSATLWADPDRIIQTLTNLLSNAIKFSPPGGKIWLTAQLKYGDIKKDLISPSSPLPDTILFSVKDQGRGIPHDKIESIFGRFQQVDASDSRQKGGTGLGLAICRSIVQQHQGRIWAESSYGEGSSFYLTLPIFRQEEKTFEQSNLTLQNFPLVLVCDDDPAVGDVLEILMKERGYRVLTTTSGQKAVELAIKEQPQAILLDLIMPGMNGWETMAALKEHPETKEIAIIMFSSLSMQESQSPDLKVRGWLRKPLDETSLFQTLAQCLRQQSHIAQVLLVEDDLDLAWLLNDMFARHAIKTVHAQTGRQAIQLCQEITPDMLVLDLGLPEYDGFAVIDWLRHCDRLRQITVVVYSAKDLTADERERLRLGKTEFLTKGRISPEEFEQRIIELFNRIIPNSEG